MHFLILNCDSLALSPIQKSGLCLVVAREGFPPLPRPPKEALLRVVNHLTHRIHRRESSIKHLPRNVWKEHMTDMPSLITPGNSFS